MTKDVIVSVYDEEITWLKNRKFSNEIIYAYNKFERFDFDFVKKLPNFGRESQTFMWHIINNYNNFTSDYLMFLQGDPFPHLQCSQDSVVWSIFHNEYEFKNLYYPLGDLTSCNALGRPFSLWNCELYSFWNELFDSNIPDKFIANFGAQQVVHKSLIMNRSKKFWETAISLHHEKDNAPWAFEILWYYIFDPRFVSSV